MNINYNISGQDILVAYDLKVITKAEARMLLGNLTTQEEDSE
jgi:hypothetical protein